MKSITILALSINKDILESHFINTFKYIEDNIPKYENEFLINGVVYTQGFDQPKVFDHCKFVRDDTVYNQGYSISEVRDYFTDKIAYNPPHPDYIFHCDDDFKFGPRSLECIINDVRYMESCKDVGLSCMHYHKGGPDSDNYWYNFNPSRVATRSGILFKVSAYDGWGGENKVRYFEECVLATKIYLKGYRVVHSVSDIIHKTKPTGLGLSLERKYGKNNIPDSGRKILCDKGYLIPSKGTNEEGHTYYRYDVPLKTSELTEDTHFKNNLKLVLGLTSTF